MDKGDVVTYFAETDFQGKRTRFGIKEGDRLRHMYVIGKKGVGKSVLLEHMAVQDIERGNGIVFFSWDGGTARALLERIPKERAKDVIYVSLHDEEWVTPFTLFDQSAQRERHTIVPDIMDACGRLFGERWNDRIAYMLEHVWFALLEYPGATLVDVNRMFTDPTFRAKVAGVITDTQTRSFWTVEFPRHTDLETREAVQTIEHVMGQIISDRYMRTTAIVRRSAFDFRRVMDGRNILIIDLSAEHLSDEKRDFLASILIVNMHVAITARRNLSSVLLAAAHPFFVYMDDVSFYTGRTFEHVLADARKAKVGLALAHQYREQLPEEVLRAIFGNVGTYAVFRVGNFDAEIFEKEFSPRCMAEDMIGLSEGEMYVRLMIDGIASPVFWARGLESLPTKEYASKDDVIALSHKTYGVVRARAEDHVRALLQEPEEKPVARKEEEKPKERHEHSPRHAKVAEEGKDREVRRPHEDMSAYPPRPQEQKKEAQVPIVHTPPPSTDVNPGMRDEDESYVSLADLAQTLLQKKTPEIQEKGHTAETPASVPQKAKQEEMVQTPRQSESPRTAEEGNRNKKTPERAVPEEVPEEILRKMVE